MIGKNDELTLIGLICLAAVAVLCVVPASAADATDATGPVIIDEQFSSTTLDPSWAFVEQYTGRGRYSLTDNAGFFRFYGEGSMTHDTWAWHPSWVDLWAYWTDSDYLIRTFDGDHWVLRTSPTYHLRGYAPYSSGAQWSVLRIGFGEGDGPLFHISRLVDAGYNANSLGVQLRNAPGGDPMSIPEGMFKDSDDVYDAAGWVHHTYWYELVRDGQQVSVGISNDGTNFVPAGSFTLPPTTGATQQIAITQNQYNPAGSYTDWDWITVQGLVSDNQPPVVTDAYSSVSCLWPPNHKFVDGQVLGVTDPDGDPVTITITGITSDEPTATDIGSGGAKHSPDASGVGTSAFKVRAERSGDLNGRIYAVTFTASDGKPNGESTGTIYVKVPHNQGNPRVPCTAVDDGQNYDATAIN